MQIHGVGDNGEEEQETKEPVEAPVEEEQEPEAAAPSGMFKALE